MNNVEEVEKKTNLVKKNFECTICIDYFENPVITNCQHVFCRKCIENYIGTKRYEKCPLCKTAISTRSLKNFDSLNKFVAKTRELEESLKSDILNLKSNKTNKEVTNRPASVTKRKRSTSEENDLIERKKANISKLPSENDEKENNNTRVENWLNYNEASNEIVPNETTRSRITITRLPKTTDKTCMKQTDLNQQSTKTVQINDQTNNEEKKNQFDMGDYMTKIDNPLKFRKDDNQMANTTCKFTTRDKSMFNDLKITKCQTPNRPIFSANLNTNPIDHQFDFNYPIDKTINKKRSAVQYIYKGSTIPNYNKSNNQTNKSVQSDIEIDFLETLLINDVYEYIKNIGINEHIEEIFTNFNKKQDLPTITSSDDSIKNNDLNDATLILSNESNQAPSSLNKENTNQIQSKILTKKKPLFKKNSNFQSSSSSENSSDSNDKLTIKNPNYLIVVDTPTKSDDASDNISAVNQTLSKSANRMELVDSRFYLQNSPRLSMLNNTSNINSPAINLSKRLNEDTIIENEAEMTNQVEETKIDEATIFKEPTAQNYSYIMDSMNSTNVLTNINNIKETFNKLPPAASDLLGISCMADSLSMTNNATNSMIRSNLTNENVNKNVEQDLKPSDKDKETQLLTDSELSVIDTISMQNTSSTNNYLEKSVSSKKNNDLKNKKIEFVCSLLKPEMKDLLKKLAHSINAKIENDVTDTTTHLVVESDENLICGVTSKYLKAVSRKIWIVSIIWIQTCVRQKQLLDPAPFEIKGDGIFGVHCGPIKSRLNKTDLFASYDIMFMGKFESETISIEDVVDLTKRNGGTIVKKAKDFGKNTTRVIIFDEKNKTVDRSVTNKMWTEASINSLTISWLLDSIACYRIFEFDTYALFDL